MNTLKELKGLMEDLSEAGKTLVDAKKMGVNARGIVGLLEKVVDKLDSKKKKAVQKFIDEFGKKGKTSIDDLGAEALWSALNLLREDERMSDDMLSLQDRLNIALGFYGELE